MREKATNVQKREKKTKKFSVITTELTQAWS